MNTQERKERYLAFNSNRYSTLTKNYNAKQKNALASIPLLFQVNKSLLPGYITPQTPHGICNFSIDEETLENINILFRNIKIDEINNESYDIEALYLQEDIKTGFLTLWILVRPDLSKQAIHLLKTKTQSILKWLNKFDLNLKYFISYSDNISNEYFSHLDEQFHIDKSLFLDEFYSESVYLSGMIPVWWLIPPENEHDYQLIAPSILEAENSEKNIYFDLGSLCNIRTQDILSACLWNLTRCIERPDITWFNILLLRHKLTHLPEIDCFATRLKSLIYDSSIPVDNINPDLIYSNLINEALDLEHSNTNYYLINNILKSISHFYHKHNNKAYKRSIFFILYSLRTNIHQMNFCDAFDVKNYFVALETLKQVILISYEWIYKTIENSDNNLFDNIDSLRTISENIINHISCTENKIQITNTTDSELIIQEKLRITHTKLSNSSRWILQVESDNNEFNDIAHSDNVYEILTWAWQNHLIDNRTRLSAYDPDYSYRQIDAINYIDIISKCISHSTSRKPLNTFTKKPEIQHSYFILDTKNDTHKTPVITLIESNTYEELYLYVFTDFNGLVDCICQDLTHQIHQNRLSKSHYFVTQPGPLIELLEVTKNLYSQLIDFVLNNSHENIYITFIFEKYYIFEKSDKGLFFKTMKSQQKIYKQLEKHSDKFRNYLINDDLFENKIISYIYRLNKKNLFQLFYKITANTAQIYILDEYGTLCRFTQSYLDNQSFLNQWLLFIYNSRKYLESVVPGHISNPLIEIYELFEDDNTSHKILNKDMLPHDKQYYDLFINISGSINNKEITFTCADKHFSSCNHGNAIYQELARFIANHTNQPNDFPLYITSIDAPYELFEMQENHHIKLIDLVNYKLNIETHLNKSLNKLLTPAL